MNTNDTQERIGKLIEGEAYRDAIHIALAPMIAKDDMPPGTNVDASGAFATEEKAVGIVDPFLRQRVRVGDRFYCFLFPNTVTSLRHMWSHPAFARKS